MPGVEQFAQAIRDLMGECRIFSSETNASRRRELITNWFGPTSEQWMRIQETQFNEQKIHGRFHGDLIKEMSNWV